MYPFGLEYTIFRLLSTSSPPLVSSMSTPPTAYFGYGSNLWKHQMVKRCPTSEYLGVARLSGYRWIINERGYANVVEMAGNKTEGETKDVVWGLVYKLQREDEQGLDKNEGVPV